MELLLMEREDRLSMKIEKHNHELKFKEKNWNFPANFPIFKP